ncbi:transporter substrate-binding domain-containing protein [Streptococcus fryi]
MKIKKILALTTFAIAAVLLVACGGQKATKESDQKGKVLFATVGTTKPFTYEVDGKLTGYDVEVARAIFEGSDKYEIEFKKTEWSSIFAGLDSDKFAMSGNNFSYSDERAEKYLYSLPTATNPLVLAVHKDSGIKDFDDIAGKTTQVVQGTATASFLESYNETNPDKATALQFTNENISKVLLNVDSGKFDYKLFETQTVKTIVEEQGLNNIEILEVEVPMEAKPYVYFLLAHGQDELKAFVDKRIKELHEDGTLEKLSQEFLGGSYLPEAE